MSSSGSIWSVRRATLKSPVPAGVAFAAIHGDLEVRRSRGLQSYDDGSARFTIGLHGAGTLDFRYESATGELQLLRLRGTDSSSQLVLFRHGAKGCCDFGLGDCTLDAPLGAIHSNAIFGNLELRRQRGRFELADGSLLFSAEFSRSTVVRYDGAHGALDIVPADGSLALDAPAEQLVDLPSAELRLIATPSTPTARVDWRQVRGPRVALRGPRSASPQLAAETLGSGEEAVFFVGAAAGRALAIETVVVRHR